MTRAIVECKGQDFNSMVLGQGICPALKCIGLCYLIALLVVICKVTHHQNGEILHILSHTGSICVNCNISALDGLLQHILVTAKLAGREHTYLQPAA